MKGIPAPGPIYFDALDRGIVLFNIGDFFTAHEVWEEAWRTHAGEPAYLLHGLIQVAAGFVKLQRGEPRGAAANLDKGARKLEQFLPGRYGLDLTRLLASVTRRSVAHGPPRAAPASASRTAPARRRFEQTRGCMSRDSIVCYVVSLPGVADRFALGCLILPRRSRRRGVLSAGTGPARCYPPR